MRVATLVLAGLAACSPPASPSPLVLLPRLAPAASGFDPTALQKADDPFWLPTGDIQRAEHQLVAARVGNTRRQARLFAVPGHTTTRVPSAAQEIEFFVSEPVALLRDAPPCHVKITATLGDAGDSAALDLAAVAEPQTWQRIRLRKNIGTEPAMLVLTATADEACGSAPMLIAQSEVTARTSGVPSTTPNIVLLILDTMRRDRLDCASRSASLMPRLTERLCDQGVFFDNAYSASSWTYPSVGSMFTGLAPREHNAIRQPGRAQTFRRDVPTVAELLGKAGYRTYGLIANPYASGALSRGFDEFVENYDRRSIEKNDSRRAATMVDLMNTWLATPPAQPFFASLLFVDTHEPVDAVLKKHELPSICEGLNPVPFGWQGILQPTDAPNAIDTQKIECRRALYDAAVRYLDSELERLFDTTHKLGLDTNTVFVVVADHGEEMWDHAAEAYREHASGAARWGVDHGHSMHDELIHVPLLIAPPLGKAGPLAGRHEDALVSTADLFATLLTLGGVATPTGNPAHDLTGALEGRDDFSHSYVFSDTTLYGPERSAVTTPTYRAIWTNPARVTVFDVQKDPNEMHPLTPDAPLYKEGDALLRRLRAKPMPSANANAPDKEALKSLGYVNE